MAVRTRSAGRPAKGTPLIDRNAIGEAALEVLRRNGPNGLSISRLAQALDVRSQTLYYHVSSITDAVNAARGVLLGGLDVAVLRDDDWEAAVVGFATEYYRVFEPLGQANSVFFMHPITDSVTLQVYERFLERAVEQMTPEVSTVPLASREQNPQACSAAVQLLLDIEHAVFSLIFEHTSWSELFDPAAIEREGATLLRDGLAHLDRNSTAAVRRLQSAVRGFVRAIRT